MVLIFMFSAENSVESSETSGSVIGLILNTFYEGYKEIPIIEQEEIISNYQNIVRTFAHGSIYFILGLFLAAAISQIEKIKTLKTVYISFSVSAVYSLSDEIHQYFVPGRAFQLSDIAVDCIGAVIGAIVAAFIMFFVKNRNRCCKKT